MPRRSIPRLTLHKSSGQARVRHQGRDIDLGPFGSHAATERSARFVAELAVSPIGADPIRTDHAVVSDPDLAVSELVLAYLDFAEQFYGADSNEPGALRLSFRPVDDLYGSTRARDFGPRALKAVRQHMIDVSKLSRTEINRRIGRIKRGFKWAVIRGADPGQRFSRFAGRDRAAAWTV